MCEVLPPCSSWVKPPLLGCGVQVKALDAETVEAQPYKDAVEAAGDMRALLEGSRQVNARRGAGVGTLPAITTAPQVGRPRCTPDLD